MSSSLENRFWSKVDIGGESDCWNWMAGVDTPGYGAFKYKGKKYNSNRMVWFLLHGEFPDLLVCHLCDNRLCCNPKHLFLGTRQDNIDDMVLKGRVASGDNSGARRHPEKVVRGEDSSNSKLTEKDVREMLIAYHFENVPAKKLISIYGIGKQHFYNIMNGGRWNHIYNDIMRT